MERLSETPVATSRTVRRKKDLADGGHLLNNPSDRLIAWRRVFQRKAEFERLLEHRMDHSAVGLLPSLTRTNSTTKKDYTKSRQLSANRTLGKPRSAHITALSDLQMTPLVVPARVSAIDLTCLGISNAIMASPSINQRYKISSEDLRPVKRNNSSLNILDHSTDGNVGEKTPSRFSFLRNGFHRKSISTTSAPKTICENNTTEELLHDALELKAKISETKNKRSNSAISRIEASTKPLCDRRVNSASKPTNGRSVLKRIKDKLDLNLKTKTELEEKVIFGTVKEVNFDGVNNLKTTKLKQKSKFLPVPKRRKNYRLFGSASTQSSRRTVTFSVADTIYEYDSEA